MIIESDKAAKLLISSVKRVRESDGDMHDFLNECVGEIATHYVCMADDEVGGIDAVDLWDEKMGGFEAGVKVGVALGDKGLVFTGFISDDEIGDPDIVLGGQWLFWFVARDEKELLTKLEGELDGWIKKERRERGFLPFEG